MRKLFLSRVWAALGLAAATVLYIAGCSHTSLSPVAPGSNAMVRAQAVIGDPQLNLEVWNPGDAPNFSRIAGRITNWGSSPIALNRITVKAWFAGQGEVPQSYVGQSWANNQTLFTPGGAWLASVAQTKVSVAPAAGQVCGANQVANWVASISFTDDSSVQIPANGGYVETNAPPSALGAWNLSTWANFESPQDYSKIGAAGTSSAARSNLQSYAIYVDGTLACEWTSPTAKDPNTGLQPCGISGCNTSLVPDPSPTVVADPTSTATVVADPTITLTPVPPTSTATATATRTFTAVPPTATATATATRTFTPDPPTATATATATRTFTAVPPTATATGTATNTATATATDVPVTVLQLEYMTFQTASTTNNPSVLFKVHNFGNTPVNADHLEVRYWFDDANWSSAGFATNVDWAGLLPLGTAITSQVSEAVVPTTGHGTQDRYASFTFHTGGTMVTPGQTIEVQARFNKTDWSSHNQTNDFSFSSLGTYQYWHNVTMYLNGALIWGPEP